MMWRRDCTVQKVRGGSGEVGTGIEGGDVGWEEMMGEGGELMEVRWEVR